VTLAEARRFEDSPDPDVRAKARGVIAAHDARKRRVRGKRGLAPGVSREARRAEDDARELAGKAAAKKRSEDPPGRPRCEDFTSGRRCVEDATDADHVLGGRWKKDMEELPNGEGFQAKCRTHHELKHGPAKRTALLEAKEHAIRIGSRGLLRHVELAVARYAAKHPEARHG
jgi:hypothetical protein